MRSLTITLVLLAVAGSAPARAGPPFRWESWVDSTLVACPAGDSTFLVVAMRFGPVEFCDVALDFGACAGFQLAPLDGTEGYSTYGSIVVVTTDHNGRAEFRLRAGGTCAAGVVRIYASGMPFGERALASMDQDGNFGVGMEDLQIAEAKLGTTDPTADFDGDGAVTAADLTILRTHLGHHAPGMATPVASRTWGTLKLTYR